jgi:hypothetical protein
MRVRWAGVAAIVAAICLAAGNYLFWRYVPADDAARAGQQTAVIVTGVLWLIAHLAMAPALIGIYSRQFRRAGLLGGTGMVLSVAGTLGIAVFVYRLFPELFGSRVYTVREMQLALFLQAMAELSIASLLAGLLCFGISIEVAGAFPRFSGLPFAAGALVAPLALHNEGFLVLAAALVAVGLGWLGCLLIFRDGRPRTGAAASQTQRPRTASAFWNTQRGD